MEKKGYVSMFIGDVSSFEELESYVMQSYTEDGDWVNSQFEKDFSIEYFADGVWLCNSSRSHLS